MLYKRRSINVKSHKQIYHLWGKASIAALFREIDSSNLPVEKEEELIKLAHQGNDFAIEKLVSANMRFVISIAKYYHMKGFPLSDLIIEGAMGLIRAIKTYEPSRGFKLISYAVHWIRKYIENYICCNEQPVKLPENLYKKIKSLLIIENGISYVNGYTNFNGNNKKTSKTLRYLTQYKNVIDNPPYIRKLTFQSIATRETTIEFNIDDIPDSVSDVPYDMYSKELKAILSQCGLTSTEKNVLYLHLGLNGMPPMTLPSIAENLKVSYQTVCRCKKNAMAKLRKFWAYMV